MTNEATLEGISATLKAQGKDFEELKDQVNGLEKILKGNGEPGMRTEVSKNTEFREDTNADIRKILFLGIGQVLVVIVALVIWGLTQIPQ